jgi:hypothetical protein
MTLACWAPGLKLPPCGKRLTRGTARHRESDCWGCGRRETGPVFVFRLLISEGRPPEPQRLRAVLDAMQEVRKDSLERGLQPYRLEATK